MDPGRLGFAPRHAAPRWQRRDGNPGSHLHADTLVVGRIRHPKGVYIRTPWSYGTLLAKGTDRNSWLRILRWEAYPGGPLEPRGSLIGERENRRRRVRVRDGEVLSGGFRHAGDFRKREPVRKEVLPWSLQKECKPADTLILTQ